MANVPDSQLCQVASPQLAVDGKVEQRELPATVGELQADTDRPDFLELKRCPLADELSLVPRLARVGRVLSVIHGWSPWLQDQSSCFRRQWSLRDPLQSVANGRFPGGQPRCDSNSSGNNDDRPVQLGFSARGSGGKGESSATPGQLRAAGRAPRHARSRELERPEARHHAGRSALSFPRGK